MQVALAVALGLLVAGGVAAWQIGKDNARRLELREAAMKPPTGTIGGPFALTNQDEPDTCMILDFHVKDMLVYFGYTYCPRPLPDWPLKVSRICWMNSAPMHAKVQPTFHHHRSCLLYAG